MITRIKFPHPCRAAALSFVAAAMTTLSIASDPAPLDDPYLWLEDVTGDKPLAWVKEQNAQSTRELEALPEFGPIRQRLLSIMDSKEKIPYVRKRGKFFYNFWRDEQHVRGLWRRTTLDEYKKPNPKWETVLDLDKLAEEEKENWVWAGAEVLEPGYDRALLSFSRGGADATVLREFDLKKKAFVPDGFTLPEAKSGVSWRNRDSIYVGTDFGPGSLTSSGYPRIAKEWRRGTPLNDARLVAEGATNDVGLGAFAVYGQRRHREFIHRSITFFSNETSIRRGDEWIRIDKPDHAIAFIFDDQLLIRPRTDWNVEGRTYTGGSLLAANLDRYLKGERKLEVLFEPTERSSLDSVSQTRRYLVLTELENVKTRVFVLRRANGRWTRTPVETPEFSVASVGELNANDSDDYFLTITDFLTPSTLYLGSVGKTKREKLKTLPAFFNADGLEIKQFEARSRDGTLVPYFQVGRKNLDLSGNNPTLLYGYGGFEVSLKPDYDPNVGSAWLERGGVYVLANIRGGGEFGPRWHEAARKENRQRAYDDFIAVAEDLHARKVTSPRHLGIQGGSNGGLLMGVMLTQRPDLFRAVVCQVPLLDMRRYNQLLAGASWMDEYGNPDVPEEWAYIRKFSPYHNLAKDKKYPRVLFTTSTRDDRVHPGHARKMVARMKELGHDVLYYENIEGGHGGAANNKQAAFMDALAYAFLLKELGSR